MKASFRVYFVRHGTGTRMTGILMRAKDGVFDPPPPAAYGASEEDVLQQLEAALREEDTRGGLARYLWEESFEVRKVAVEIHPQAVIEKRLVIGRQNIPLRLSYAYARLDSGAYRVMLPRFGWWFILEDLELAPEVIRNAISTALLGEKPRWIYDFRQEGEELVREWSPDLLLRADLTTGTPDEAMAKPTLSAVADELVEKASRHKLAPVVGAMREVDAHQALYERVPPASLLLVGGPGVGKSTFVRRLASRFAAMRRERKGSGRKGVPRIWATSGDRIIAGMVYLGMWQQRCLDMVEELRDEGDYLYVDRLTSILKLQPDGATIADIFAPAILGEEISLIAECSEAELERLRRRSPAFVDAFQIIRVPETAPAAMPEMLQLYEQKKGGTIEIHPTGLKRLVQHLDAFQRDARFPGKGFRFLDWLHQAERGSLSLFPSDISRLYSRYSGLPVELISDDHPAGALDIAETLMRRVIGQDDACRAAARILARFKAGLNDPDRPSGTMLFVGPTGVGKTELAKQLARYMFGDEARMVRLDMSEYVAPGSSRRLLEVGEGVQSLAERVRQQPLSLILLDEIEKAEPEVFDVLLGILGEGRLTDTLGRLVDFRMSLIIMTSNLGVTDAREVGFGGEPAGDYLRTVRQHFRPEFTNRIDRVVTFRRLSRPDIERIVDLELAKLTDRTGLLRRNLTLEVTPEARQLLAELGFHPTRGARPLKRTIEERVITPLAVRMARDPAFRDQRVLVRREAGEIALS